MKLATVSLILAASAVVWTGCVNPDGSQNSTGTGALIGGAFGALVGAAAGGRHGGEDALIGAAAGVAAGALVGNAIDRDQQARLQTQAPDTYVRVTQQSALTVSDIKAFAHAGLSDDVIIAQINSSHTGFHLSSFDIIDLRNAGVSERVITFMINTAGDSSAIPSGTSATVVVSQPPPPPPVEETIGVAPGVDYFWVSGEWVWTGRWVWVGGHWAYPPHPHGVWVQGYWVHGPNGWYHTEGYWR